MQLVLAKRGGFRRNKEIPNDKISGAARDIRKAAAADKRSKINPNRQSSSNRVPLSSPATSVAGNVTPFPVGYVGIDYVEQEKELRDAVHGPWRERAQVSPQEEGPVRTFRMAARRMITTRSCFPTPIDPWSRLTSTNGWSACSERTSSFVKARFLQYTLRGVNDVSAPIKHLLEVAAELALQTLQDEAARLLGNKLRTGKCDAWSSGDRWKAKFGEIWNEENEVYTASVILGRRWAILDYGGVIPGSRDDPINDIFGEVVSERNQWLAIHLAAGHIRNKNDPQPIPRYPQVMKMLAKLGGNSTSRKESAKKRPAPRWATIRSFLWNSGPMLTTLCILITIETIGR